MIHSHFFADLLFACRDVKSLRIHNLSLGSAPRLLRGKRGSVRLKTLKSNVCLSCEACGGEHERKSPVALDSDNCLVLKFPALPGNIPQCTELNPKSNAGVFIYFK